MLGRTIGKSTGLLELYKKKEENKLGQQETAKQIWDYLTSRGWTKQSVSALLGNMQSESGIIADRWESDRVGNMNGGYGLVQWTPATKYIDWAKSNGLAYQDVFSQCKRIEWEVANNQQFYHPSMTFAQFTKSTASPETLADIFIRYYERPLNPNQPARGTQARYWCNLFQGSTPSNRRKVVDWFNTHRNQITYSMTGSRIGTDGTADCSGSIVIALKEATGVAYDYVYNTVTLGGYLSKCGYTRILTGNMSGSNLNQMQDEDIILLSAGNSMAESGGAGGHTGVITGGGKIITSTCYYTNGQANTAIQDLPINSTYLSSNSFKYYEVWRKAGESETDEGEIEMYLIYTVDTNNWYVSNGVQCRWVKTERALKNYKDEFGKLNLRIDNMYSTELYKEFPKDTIIVK